MAQHVLLSARARSLTVGAVLRMADRDAEATFAGIRWADTGGKAVCPHCGCPTCYEARRPNGSLRFRCKACRKDFSLTSGTLFALHKLPLQTYLTAVVIFCNEVKGKSALACGCGRSPSASTWCTRRCWSRPWSCCTASCRSGPASSSAFPRRRRRPR